VSPTPRHGTPAGDATIALQKLARRTGADVQELQTLYVLEALLDRIATSKHRDDFVLKGGVLLAAFAVRRPTRDIDLQATRLANDTGEVAARVREIAGLDVPDGVVFDPPSVTAAIIRDDDEYAGIRVKLIGMLGRARLTIGIDVNFGDPVWPAPSLIELPRIIPLGRPPMTMLGYPLPMVLAEKIVTAIDRGEANTRWRDFADLHTLTRVHRIQADELAASLNAVAAYRKVELSPLLPTLSQMQRRAQPKWRAWRTRVHREQQLPLEFDDVLKAVAAFADPVLNRNPVQTWDPRTTAWEHAGRN
jgi:predicted nucleotidyltransferase component of viral defense system